MTRTMQHDQAVNNAGRQALLDADAADALLTCLDAQIDLLDRREAELDALSESIIASDNDRMEQVLDQMTLSRQLQAQADAELQDARDSAAARLGWRRENTRLERLLGVAEPNSREMLQQRRRQVMERAERISIKHRQAAVLLAECTRINRLLMECFVGPSQRVTLYGQQGRQQWHGSASLMDTER